MPLNEVDSRLDSDMALKFLGGKSWQLLLLSADQPDDDRERKEMSFCCVAESSSLISACRLPTADSRGVSAGHAGLFQ